MASKIELAEIRSMRPRMFGIAFFFAWCLTMFFDADHAPHDAFLSFASCVGNVLGLACIWAMSARYEALYRSRWFCWGSAVVVGAATVFVGLAGCVGSPLPNAFYGICGFLTGIGSSGVSVVWGCYYSGLDHPKALLSVLGSCAMGVALYAATALLLHSLALMVMGVLLVCGGVMSHRCIVQQGPGAVRGHTASSMRGFVKRTWRGVIAMFVLGVVFWTFWFGRMHWGGGMDSVHPIAFLIVSVCMVVMACIGRFNTEVMLQVCLVTSILGVAITFGLSSDFEPAGLMLSLLAYICMDAYLIILLCEGVRESGCNPVRGFSLGRSVDATAVLLGAVLSAAAERFGVNESTMAFPLFIMVAVVVAMNLMMDSHSRSRLRESQEEDGAAASAVLFARRCKSAIVQYGLSPREAEIMLLITQGRSIPYVADTLHIARSTAKTHVTSMYKKMGVASRQEMLDLIESLPVEQ